LPRTNRLSTRHDRRELIDAVRAERPRLPIVLATAYDELPSELACGVPRLLKPFMQGQLLQIVNETVRADKTTDGS
jgi:CheY-like chemotaxis protein